MIKIISNYITLNDLSLDNNQFNVTVIPDVRPPINMYTNGILSSVAMNLKSILYVFNDNEQVNIGNNLLSTLSDTWLLLIITNIPHIIDANLIMFSKF